MSQRKRDDGHSGEHIRVAYHANRQAYSSPRLHAEVQAQGIRCSRKRVARLMKQRGLCARRVRCRTVTTRQEPGRIESRESVGTGLYCIPTH
jgi:putative transposase